MRIVGRRLDLSRPLVMGILNVTPDSFSDGGELRSARDVLAKAQQLVTDGADILDVGGESTRPGAAAVSIAAELGRVINVISMLSHHVAVPISIDTRRAIVARAALAAGAHLVNDVSGFADPEMADVVRESGAGWVVMHMPHDAGQMGWSRASEGMPDGVVAARQRVADDLGAVVQRAVIKGVARDQLALDPGIGFGKSVAQNLGFLRAFGPVARLGLPILVGPSRKSFIGEVTGAAVTERLHGTSAAVAAAILAGARIVRVHDVAAMRQVVQVAAAIRATDDALG